MIAIVHESISSLAAACVAADIAYAKISAQYESFVGAWPSLAVSQMERLMVSHRASMSDLAHTPARSLDDLRAKGRALRTNLDDNRLLASLLNDLENLA